MRCCFAPFPKAMGVVALPPSPKWHAWLFCPLLPSGHDGCCVVFLSFWVRFGFIQRPWEVLGSSIWLLGLPWGVLGADFCSSGVLGGVLGRSLGVPGGSLGDPGASLVGPWGLLGVPGKLLGGPGSSLGCPQGASGGPWAVPRVPPEVPLSVIGTL